MVAAPFGGAMVRRPLQHRALHYTVADLVLPPPMANSKSGDRDSLTA
jgi:hypothetical protein